jgi:hypothetical protein
MRQAIIRQGIKEEEIGIEYSKNEIEREKIWAKFQMTNLKVGHTLEM